MIVNALLYLIFGVVYLISYPLRLLPDVSFPQALYDAISTAGAYITPMNTFVPITTILTILGLVLGIEGFIFLYKSTMWVIRRIPTQS